MADPNQLALLLRSVKAWNTWYNRMDHNRVNLRGADLRGADLSGANFSGGDLRGANFRGANLCKVYCWDANLSGANLSEANLDDADFRGSNLSNANLSKTDLRTTILRSYTNIEISIGVDLRGADFREADLRGANLSGADLRGADFRGANVNGAKGLPSSITSKAQPGQSSSTTSWLSLVETYGSNILVAATTIASIIQGLDVVERRWREKKEKKKQQSAQASSAPSPQPTPSLSPKGPDTEKEITDIRLVMDDGQHHTFKCWVSDPDTLRAYIDAFSDPTSKTRPLQVTFVKREGRALVVDITEGGKDNPQLNVILGYLEADPQ